MKSYGMIINTSEEALPVLRALEIYSECASF